MLAALPAEIAFAVAAVRGARGEIDDVGEVTGTRGADAAGEGSGAEIIEDDDAFLVRLVRETLQGEGKRLALMGPGTGGRDGSGTDHDGVPPWRAAPPAELIGCWGSVRAPNKSHYSTS